MKQFSDFAKEEERLEGDKVKLDSILGEEIIIQGFTLAKSKFKENKTGQYITVQFSKGEDKQVFFSGSDVIIDQLQRYKDEIPFKTTIKKVNKYYTLS